MKEASAFSAVWLLPNVLFPIDSCLVHENAMASPRWRALANVLAGQTWPKQAKVAKTLTLASPGWPSLAQAGQSYPNLDPGQSLRPTFLAKVPQGSIWTTLIILRHGVWARKFHRTNGVWAKFLPHPQPHMGHGAMDAPLGPHWGLHGAMGPWAMGPWAMGPWGHGPCHVMSYHVMSCHVMSCDVM